MFLLHQELLAEAKDPEKCPVFHVRFMENLQMKPDRNDDLEPSTTVPSTSSYRNMENRGDFEPWSKLGDLNLDIAKKATGGEGQHVYKGQEVQDVPMHEIIFSTIDKPKLLSQLSALLSDIGLNIREAHVFSTVDGYSLDVFVVDGWPVEDTDGLREAVGDAVSRSEGSWSGSISTQSIIVKALAEQLKDDDWEIDRKFLKIGEKIASGSCGDLHHGVYQGNIVAVKVIKSEQLTADSAVEFAQEVTILREVNHRNVVRLVGACTKHPQLCIITEYMQRGSLYDYLCKHHNLLELTLLLQFAIDICKGMEYLHQKSIIHRDLKTANLLMDTENVMNHQPYDQRADAFSFAIVLWELTTGKVPYDSLTPIQAARRVRQGGRPKLPLNAHPRILDLMQRCWQAVPGDGSSFSEIVLELEQLQQKALNVLIREKINSRIHMPKLLQVPEDMLYEFLYRLQDDDLKRCRMVAKSLKEVISYMVVSPSLMKKHLRICRSASFYVYIKLSHTLFFYVYSDGRLVELPTPEINWRGLNVLGFYEGIVLLGNIAQAGPLTLYHLHSEKWRRFPRGTPTQSVSIVLGCYPDIFELFVMQVYEEKELDHREVSEKKLHYRVLDLNQKYRRHRKWRDGGTLVVSELYGSGVAMNGSVFFCGFEEGADVLLKINAQSKEQKTFPLPTSKCRCLDIFEGYVTVFDLSEELSFHQFEMDKEKWLPMYYSFKLRELGWYVAPNRTSLRCSVDGFFLFQTHGEEIMRVSFFDNNFVKIRVGKVQCMGGGYTATSCFLARNKAFLSTVKPLAEQLKDGDWEIDRSWLTMGEKIASGSCGDLHHGYYKGKEVAVKVIKSEQLTADSAVEFAQEVKILREVNHRNVVRLVGACTKYPQLCIITEYMQRGSLYDYLRKHHNLLELPLLLKFAIDICKGMEYLHQKSIIHRNLKTANLLMDTENVVKVADFGVARFQNRDGVMTAETGSYRWMAPEVMNHQPYDQKADVFSFAIVLWELTTGKVPYDTLTPIQAALRVRQGGRPELPPNAHPRILVLMQRCWQAVPGDRPSFSEIVLELEQLQQDISAEPES